MAFLQFPKTQLIKKLDTGEKFFLGGFKMSSNQEFAHARPLMYIAPNLLWVTNEKCRLHLHTSTNIDAIYDSSDWVFVSDFIYNFGFVKFDFNRSNINENLFYYISIETANYTATASNYIGLAYDNYLFPINNVGVGSPASYTDFPIAVQLFGYK